AHPAQVRGREDPGRADRRLRAAAPGLLPDPARSHAVRGGPYWLDHPVRLARTAGVDGPHRITRPRRTRCARRPGRCDPGGRQLMRLSKPGRLGRIHARNAPLRRAKHGDLDILMPPPYEIPAAAQQEAREKVESLIARLQPGGLDGNSRDVLNNLINDWMDQEIARLLSHREEWKAVASMLTGLAREEVALRRHRYEADYGRAQQDRQALALAYEQLTGAPYENLPSPYPQH